MALEKEKGESRKEEQIGL